MLPAMLTTLLLTSALSSPAQASVALTLGAPRSLLGETALTEVFAVAPAGLDLGGAEELAPQPVGSLTEVDGPVDSSGIDWARVDKRAQGVYTAGWITGIAGFGVVIVGALNLSPEAVILGAFAMYASPAMMAGSSLRSEKALSRLGASELSPTMGIVAWSTWGASFILGYADPTGTVSGLCYLGSIAFGIVQGVQNGMARRRLGLASAPVERKRFQVALAPVVTDGGARGLALAGRF